MSDSDEPNTPSQNEATAYLNYNVRWMTRTFNSRAQVESLLGPERSAGNISTNDYEAAAKFLPGYHRYYGLLFSMVAVSAVYLRARPSWSPLRMWTIASGSAFASLAIGNGLTLRSHYEFVQALDNPSGFSSALERIQRQTALPLPPSPIIARRIKVGEDLHGNTSDYQGFTNDAAPEPNPEQASETKSLPQPSGERTPSKWDQIRAVNTASSRSSSWDALRQKHEKVRNQRGDSSAPTSPKADISVDNRAVEQAQFDALLEKERRLGSQQS